MHSLLINVGNFSSLEARPNILTPPFCSEKGQTFHQHGRLNFLNSKDSLLFIETGSASKRWNYSKLLSDGCH